MEKLSQIEQLQKVAKKLEMAYGARKNTFEDFCPHVQNIEIREGRVTIAAVNTEKFGRVTIYSPSERTIRIGVAYRDINQELVDTAFDILERSVDCKTSIIIDNKRIQRIEELKKKKKEINTELKELQK